jgi:S-DNA-T family DNA segregation ATPase FtsK/SpoIIIE
MSLFNGLHIPYYSPLLRGTRHANHLKNNWPKAVTAANLHIETSGRKIRVPKLSRVEIASEDGDQVTALVDMATVGGTSRELSNKIEHITAALHAYQTRVERIDPAQSRITVSFSPPRRPHYDPTTSLDLDLEQFPIHLDAYGGEASITLTKSVLIGGESESGKSNLVWYILSQLNDHQIPYRLHVIDPAGGVELSDLETAPITRQYVDRIGEIPAIVSNFRKSMDRRMASMKQRHQRRHFPTIAEPVEILIIDEILLCKKELKGGDADSPLGEVLASGRKALHIVIACSQLGEKLVIGQIRDLFPQRLCLRTRTSDITDAVLGSQATQDGAMCHRITARGEGYAFTDQSGVFEKFSAPLVRETATVALGGTTAPTIPIPTRRSPRRHRGRTFVYQFFNTDDPTHPYYNRPAYVGITNNPRKRFKQHEQEWPTYEWSTIVTSRTKITAYPTWDEAKAMETQLIEYWKPIYNVQEIS